MRVQQRLCCGSLHPDSNQDCLLSGSWLTARRGRSFLSFTGCPLCGVCCSCCCKPTAVRARELRAQSSDIKNAGQPSARYAEGELGTGSAMLMLSCSLLDRNARCIPDLQSFCKTLLFTLRPSYDVTKQSYIAFSNWNTVVHRLQCGGER